MAFFYRPVRRDQSYLLPPDMRDWLPEGHLVWTLLEMVDRLDTSAFHRPRPRGAGRAGYHPDMLLAVLLLGYCTGVRSARAIERSCRTDAAFRIACGDDVPDHTVLARFRQAHEAAFVDLFSQVLRLAAGLGMVRFGTVAIDGTKIKANASLGANRGGEWLDRQAAEIVAEAVAADDAEDALLGGANGDELPPEYAQARARRARLDLLVEQFEASKAAAARRDPEARAEARMEALRRGEMPHGGDPAGVDPVAAAELRLAIARDRAAARLQEWQARNPPGSRRRGTPPAPVDDNWEVVAARTRLETARAAAEQDQADGAGPDPEAEQAEAEGAGAEAEGGADGKGAAGNPKQSALAPRVNTTDPESRIQPTRKGWIQGYNAQFAVTGDQLIVACSLGQSPADDPQFLPMMRKTIDVAAMLAEHTGTAMPIGAVLADAGYSSNANLNAEGPDRLIALGKSRHLFAAAKNSPAEGEPDPGWSAREKMAHRLATSEGSAAYKRRGATVEPGIGNYKKILPEFSRRGTTANHAELHFAAAAFNLLKIHRAGAA